MLISFAAAAQVSPWSADNGDGTYTNPVLHADYSDPDACRVGDSFYMTASSFNAAPGLPILQSKDLVNWNLIGYALPRQPPFDHFSIVQHGNGVWAPSIRYHDQEFWIYYPDPDFGIYLIKSKDPKGPWSEPVLVEAGKGLIDPCPLWDDDGRMYLVHAYAGSRAGIKSIIVVKPLGDDGTRVTGEGRLVYDGHEKDPTVEGPKFYKRNGYYYIFAPAGDVSTGWQIVLRSKNIWGPYERRVVMEQGNTNVNGPHQGAWVQTGAGEDWFLHFQDKEAYGRVVHLQPMRWVNDWPVIGVDNDNDGIGNPVRKWKKPLRGMPSVAPPVSDEFNDNQLGLQWQWQANPSATWHFLTPDGSLRLYSQSKAGTLWDVPNLLLQKFPAENFEATTMLNFSPNTKLVGEAAGLVIMGLSYAALRVQNSGEGLNLVYVTCDAADKGTAETVTRLAIVTDKIYLRVRVTRGAMTEFSYSLDGKTFNKAGAPFKARPGKWVGAKIGIFCTRDTTTNDAGYADFDWFRAEPLDN